MQQIVFINDAIPSGKLLINLLKEFKSGNKQKSVVTFLTDEELEEIAKAEMYLDEIPDYLALNITTEYQKLKMDF